MSTKQCGICEKNKPNDEFSLKQSVCKECRASQTAQLRKLAKENKNKGKNNIGDPDMIYIHKKISILNDLFVKSIPTITDLKEHMLELFEAYQSLDDKTVMFYFPIVLSDTTKAYFKAAFKQGLNVDNFKYSILRNNRDVIVKDLGLDLHVAYKCLDEIEMISNMINAVRMGYYCINKYIKDAMKNSGANQKTDDLYVEVVYDVDADMVILKQNPMQLTIVEFVDEIRKIIKEFKEILVLQFEDLGMYDKLLAIGRNNIVETSF
jgi:hypothetical protein